MEYLVSRKFPYSALGFPRGLEVVPLGCARPPQTPCLEVTVQPDGKILVAGQLATGTDDFDKSRGDFALARYNPDGSLDTSFDGDGIVTTSVFPRNPESATGLAMQTDGKIVVAGFGGAISEGFDDPVNDFVLLRYNADGSLDPSFDSDGMVTIDFGLDRDDQAAAVIVQPDGKLVVAGHSQFEESNVFALARLNADGSLDTVFGKDGNGKQTTDFPEGTGGRAMALVFQPGGKLVAAGIRDLGDDKDPAEFALVRYQPNGREDTTSAMTSSMKLIWDPTGSRSRTGLR